MFKKLLLIDRLAIIIFFVVNFPLYYIISSTNKQQPLILTQINNHAICKSFLNYQSSKSHKSNLHNNQKIYPPSHPLFHS